MNVSSERHARWVRVAHWIVTASVLTLAVTGFVILMAHPRLYWGEAGNDLTPALLELPISRNYQHGGWGTRTPVSADGAGPISANRTYDIFNQNGWGRSLHFLAAWCLVVPGVVYLLAGIGAGHFRSHLVPRVGELAPRRFWQEVVDHLRLRIPAATGGPNYGVLQKEGWTAIGQWIGVPLSLVLDAAGVLPTARFVLFHSYDDWVDSIDLLDALHPQTILAYGMNGRDLPLAHGAPVRLRVERQLGYKSMKYLQRIIVADEFDDGGKKGNIQNGWAWYTGI